MVGQPQDLKQEYNDSIFWKVSHLSQNIDELMAEMEL